MAVVHKLVKPGDGVQRDPPRVRKFPGRPSDDPSRERVNDLVRSGFLDPSAATPYVADPERDRLPNKRAT